MGCEKGQLGISQIQRSHPGSVIWEPPLLGTCYPNFLFSSVCLRILVHPAHHNQRQKHRNGEHVPRLDRQQGLRGVRGVNRAKRIRRLNRRRPTCSRRARRVLEKEARQSHPRRRPCRTTTLDVSSAVQRSTTSRIALNGLRLAGRSLPKSRGTRSEGERVSSRRGPRHDWTRTPHPRPCLALRPQVRNTRRNVVA